MSELTSFADLGLSAQTIAAIASKGFEEPTKIQAACIPLLLKDQVDVIGQAQTGTGKTAAYSLPILEIVDPSLYQVQALILAPTRELAVQTAEEISSLRGDRRLEIAAVYGGASMELQLRTLRRGTHVVVGTPGRILDHLRRGSLNLEHLKFVVLDEADEMLDMGFIDDIEEVLKQTPEEKRMLCFSATMPAPIQRLAERFMHEPQMVKIQQDTNTSDLTDQIYIEVRESDKLEALTRIIDMEESFYGIVFCRTKVQCDEIGRKLMDRGYDAEPLHGDLSQKQRELILHKMRERSISIIVATDVAARGIDISDLTHVINFSLPEDPDAYIHRVGRTGRAGKTGVAITFVANSSASPSSKNCPRLISDANRCLRPARSSRSSGPGSSASSPHLRKKPERTAPSCRSLSSCWKERIPSSWSQPCSTTSTRMSWMFPSISRSPKVAMSAEVKARSVKRAASPVFSLPAAGRMDWTSVC